MAAAHSAKGIFIGATGQHAGKTTTCLGLMSGLLEKFDTVSFCKPVGQQWKEVSVSDGSVKRVDKDCVLFREHFRLKQSWDHISPVLMPRGFTRDYLDGAVSSDTLVANIKTSYAALEAESDFVVVEGTGHTGVGSICDISNARVASELGLDFVLVAFGGLGSSFDQVALNVAMLKQYGVKLRGVIVNQVVPSKRDMILEYYTKALARWDVPVLGCIPYKADLRAPSVADLQTLLGARLVAGEEHRLRHFSSTRLAVGFYDEFTPFDPVPNQLVVTHATRTDIMAMIVRNHRAAADRGMELNTGLIVTGASTLPSNVISALNSCGVPTLAVAAVDNSAMFTFQVLSSISDFTRKMDASDSARLEAAISHVKQYTAIDAIVGADPVGPHSFAAEDPPRREVGSRASGTTATKRAGGSDPTWGWPRLSTSTRGFL